MEEATKNKDQRLLTMEEVALHNTKEDAWVVVAGGVYDITDYAKMHIKGSTPEHLLAFAGKDCTQEFMAIHSYLNIRALLNQHFIGYCKVLQPAFLK